MPAESQWQRPRHTRSSVSFMGSERVGLGGVSENGDDDGGEYVAPESDDGVGDGARSRSQSRGHSYSYSHVHILEDPTSNPAAYAKGTHSYSKKMNERMEYPFARTSSTGRDGGNDERENDEAEDLTPTTPTPTTFHKHDRKRAKSAYAAPSLLRDNYTKRLREAFDATGKDLLDLQDDLHSGRGSLSFREVLGRKDGLPREFDELRGKFVGVLECFERRGLVLEGECERLREDMESKQQENDGLIVRQLGRIRDLDREVKTRGEEFERRTREKEAEVQMREKRIVELQGELDTIRGDREQIRKQVEQLSRRVGTLDDSLAQKTKQLEQASDRFNLQAQKLEEASKANQVQAEQIEQLKAALEIRPAASAPFSDGKQLQEALHRNEQQAQKIRQLEEALQANLIDHALATGTDVPEWHEPFQRMKEIKDSHERENALLKASLETFTDTYEPLEEQVNTLIEDLTIQIDNVESLQSQLTTATALKDYWQDEYSQQKKYVDRHTPAEETAVSNLRQELHDTIAAYHALMPSPTHPDALQVSGLLRKLQAQEKDSSETTQLLDSMKTEKGKLEREIEKLMDEKKDLVLENRRLVYGPPSSPRVTIDNETGLLIRQPTWEATALIQKRAAKLAAFKRKQDAVREKEEAKAQLVEKARRWKMGKLYPPSKGTYPALLEKSEWERWEGRTWVETVAVDEEYVEARELGLLGKESKGRRTEEWKGKDWREMGLRAWEEE